MKKYIKPTIGIEISDLEGTLLAGLSKYQKMGAEGDEFSNSSSFEDDDMAEFKNKSLWSDED